MSNMRGFDAAQRAYDNATPPADGPSECPDCSAGMVDTSGFGDFDACETCNGSGYIEEDGSAHDPHQAQRDADDAADSARDERLTRSQP
jgi:hypothetical protein